MRFTALAAVLGCCAVHSTYAADAGAAKEILNVRRIYVDQLTGDASAQALRDLVIASVTSTGLFVLTDNPDRADAVLRGAAGDEAFDEVHDSSGGVSTHQTSGRYGGSSVAALSRASGGYGGVALSDNESMHSKERKHNAYATVRLCTRDGDVLWATTQESGGAKFRGASADVAAKIARQLSLDVDIARRAAATPKATANPGKPVQQP